MALLVSTKYTSRVDNTSTREGDEEREVYLGRGRNAERPECRTKIRPECRTSEMPKARNAKRSDFEVPFHHFISGNEAHTDEQT